MKCPLCKTPLKDRADQKYFICSVCGAYVMDEKFYVTPQREKNRYEEHNNDVNDVGYQAFTSSITHAVLERFEPHHKGLDYGSGTGPVIAKMLQDRGYNVKLYDPFFHPDNDYLNHRYDYIFSCEVFEHFFHPREEINKLLHLLKPGGYLLIKTNLMAGQSNFKNWQYRNDPTHVFLYTPQTMHYIENIFPVIIEEMDNQNIVMRKKNDKEL
ncbi:MAG: methyltransferase domain-containing protein [Bacteroidales bacterium]